jgi:predicted nucleic acid-binding protein
MRSSKGLYILTDAGFWIGLCDERDEHNEESTSIMDIIQDMQIVIPWPITYEVLRTRGLKSKGYRRKFTDILKDANIEYLDDQPYRERALDETLNNAEERERYISLVDMVIRHILSDENVRVDYFVTFNKKDFYDICLRRGIEILANP